MFMSTEAPFAVDVLAGVSCAWLFGSCASAEETARFLHDERHIPRTPSHTLSLADAFRREAQHLLSRNDSGPSARHNLSTAPSRSANRGARQQEESRDDEEEAADRNTPLKTYHRRGRSLAPGTRSRPLETPTIPLLHKQRASKGEGPRVGLECQAHAGACTITSMSWSETPFGLIYVWVACRPQVCPTVKSLQDRLEDDEYITAGSERAKILRRVRDDAHAIADAFKFAGDDEDTLYMAIESTSTVTCQICPPNAAGFPKVLVLANAGDVGNIFSHLKTTTHRQVSDTHPTSQVRRSRRRRM